MQLTINSNRAGLVYLAIGKEVTAKQCSRCGQLHDLDKFNKAGHGFAGKHSACKECHRKRDTRGRLL